nr:tyrosine protein phosphatase non receptor type [Hymenolepis microstoma]
MNHGSSSRPNFLFATPRHIPDTDRSLHQMCLSPDCVSANIPPPQLPQSSPKEGFSSILSFWADIEQSSSRSTSITMPRLNPPLTNGLSRCRVGGGINHLSSGTTSDMDSISNSTSSRPQKNEPLKPSGSEESSDIDNFSAPYEIIVPPKPPKTPKPILSTPQTKVFQPPYGIGYGEYANIPKNGPPLPPPVPPEKEDSPPILPPKSPILRPVSQDNRILLNGIQSMPRLNGNSLKSNEPKPPSPIPIKILLQNGKSNHNKPVMANGNTKRSNFNRFSPNFRYSFNRPPDEKPNKISTARSISAYGAVRELTPELPLKSTSKRPATAMDTNVGVFQVRYPTMSVTHAPTNVPIVKAETDQNTTQSFNHTPVPRRSSSRGGESSFQFGGENRRSLRTNGYVNVAPNFCRNSRPSSEIRHQHSTKSISNRSGGGGFGGNTDTSSVSPNHSDENLVTVTILPNAEGQYGFNVSGGSDQKRPVVVSRVGERMPAATCCPRLHAGDQIILINYRDISDYTQDQVISSIRKSAESQSGVLELVVKPNIYLEENAMDDQETGDAPPRPPKSLVSTNRDSSPLSSWLHPSAPKRSESSPISNNRHPNQRPAPQSTPVQTQYQVVSQNSPPKITPKPRFGSSTTVKVKSTSGNGPRKALISDTEALFHSIREIEAGLADGSLVKQFEKLERGNPNATMVDAKANENIPKNRYRDISPYDHSRVRIQGVDGDYINASFVKLKIPKWGLQREYIASQGPLPSTCADFWQMCWEQESELIVMLTSVREQGRVKCHKYWPDLNQTSEFTWTHAKSSKLTSSVKCIQLRISNIKEEVTADIAYREFHLQRIVTTTKDMLNSTGPTRHRIISFSHDKGPAILNGSDVRRIVQLQYISWPDHGVPNNCSDLIAFVERMRSLREQGDSACTIVHCSAGIGRTGVVILLDTAMDMIRAHIPLRPLEIVRQMREYREMLIQTPAQFQFVSNAIVQYYYDTVLKSHKTKKS